MKKILSVTVVAIMVVALSLTTFAGSVYNFIIDVGFKYSDDVASITGWACVDSDAVAAGYKIDGGEPVWVITTISTKSGEIKDNSSQMQRDSELEGAIVNMGMNNGLDYALIHGYRFRIYENLSYLEAGSHTITFVMKFSDGSIADAFQNPQGNSSTYSFTKTTAASGSVVTSGSTDTQSSGGNGGNNNPKTGDAAIIAVAAVACVSLAGVVIAKKVR